MPKKKKKEKKEIIYCEGLGSGMFRIFLAFLLTRWVCIFATPELFAHLPQNASDEHRRLASEHYHRLTSLVDFRTLRQVLGNNTDYRKKFPFPHMTADNIFPQDILEAANLEIADNPQMENGCVKGNAKCFLNAKTELKKNAFEDDHQMGPATAALFAFLKSSHFIKFLETMTGIKDIIPDPHYFGSGIHQTLSGGFLQLHADFNRYKKYDWHRRVNVFIYMNPDWKDEYGGHLELWHRDLKRCGAMIRPTLGRLSVFSTTDFSYHGHPNPLMTPPNRSRRSIAMYYYTPTRPSSECIWWNCKSSHSTLWQTAACSSCSDKRCKSFKEIV